MDAIRIVQQAIDYMEERLDERLELERIAEAAAMSVPNLYRLFYAMTGHPIKEYLRKRRTSEAALLLRQSDLPVIDIAFACGFDSYQAFTKTFKKLTGLTPSTYRKSGLFYSFERIRLWERVLYKEERELSELHPDVKVIRVWPMQTIAYRHYSEESEGLEEEGFRVFCGKLSEYGVDIGKVRIFGYNLESTKERHDFGYQMMALTEDASHVSFANGLFAYSFPGGLYAVNRIAAGPAASIIAAWNRLLAEWLPRSTFVLGEHVFLEEYQHYKGSTTRMKLYLPVSKKQEQGTIEIVELPSVRAVSFRAAGADSPATADELLMGWLQHCGLAGDERLQLFMSCSYGIPPGADYWYELGVIVPQDVRLLLDSANERTLDGGLYAYLKTGAYGAMTGVLDILYRWVSKTDGFEPDGDRQWFARYVPGDGPDIERSTMVECYVPVRHKS